VSRLAVERLGFGHPGVPVGRDVSFTVEGGEVLCLLGPNGGGKTTLFRTILRLLEPRDGAVRVDGESIAGWSRGRMARCFGYVPQAQLGVFPFTVREIVLMGRTAHIGAFATPSAADRAMADAALAQLAIGDLAHRPYTQLSGGERQLVLIARALAQEPAVLIMDEPTASLDFGNQVRVLAEVRELARRGIAVILSTHDPDQAFLCAHRVALLHRGRLAALGPPADVITPEHLAAAYGVSVAIVPIEQDGQVRTVCLPSLDRRVERRAQAGPAAEPVA
jgi:iron complex transport system ATP-binding protein